MASLVVSAIVAVVGAAVSAYGSYQSGKAQAAIANANAKEQERQAKNSLATLNAQSQMQSAEAEMNFKLRKSEADARKRNAEQLEAQTLQQDAINRANMQKRRQEFAAMQAEQRVALADSGVLEASGTPLDLLAETAAKIQQDADEQHLSHEQKRRTLFREADMERLGGELALQGATLDRNLGLTQAALTAFTGQAEYNAGMRKAEITRLTGRAAKQAATYEAAGTLISSLGSTGMTYATS